MLLDTFFQDLAPGLGRYGCEDRVSIVNKVYL